MASLTDLRLRVGADAAEVAALAAQHLANELRSALAERPVVTFAVSGGSTPAATFEALAGHSLAWDRVYLVQVDERVSSVVDGDRNLTMQQFTLAGRVDLGGMLSMPVGEANLDRAAATFAEDLAAVAGDPIVLDVVQLGLGADGHTASLVAGDAAVEERDRAVAVTGSYQGRHRMTLTMPVLQNARSRVWVVTGASKHQALAQTLGGDTSVPGGMLAAANDVFFVDRAAVSG